MTETEWLACNDPRPMIGFLRARLSDRKGRLYAVASCRLAADLFSSEAGDSALNVAERFADGTASDDERSGAWACIDEERSLSDRPRDESWWADSAAETALMGMYPLGSWYKAAATVCREVLYAVPESLTDQLALFRCIVGNPFQPVVLDSPWKSSTVMGLARQIYDTKDFTPTPILADALQDAGCDNGHILNHLRGPGPHVRGCFVIDLILGKA